MIQSHIELTQIEFFAYHGVMEQEKTVGNRFFVDIRLNADLKKAIESDRIEDTINYAEVYELVKKEMQIPSNLLEHVAGRIIQALKIRFPRLSAIKVSISKASPPIEGQIACAKVEIEEIFQ